MRMDTKKQNVLIPYLSDCLFLHRLQQPVQQIPHTIRPLTAPP